MNCISAGTKELVNVFRESMDEEFGRGAYGIELIDPHNVKFTLRAGKASAEFACNLDEFLEDEFYPELIKIEGCKDDWMDSRYTSNRELNELLTRFYFYVCPGSCYALGKTTHQVFYGMDEMGRWREEL